MAEGTGADQWEKCPNFSSFASVALLTPEKRSHPRHVFTASSYNDSENRGSRNSANFAVALNCGIGSSSLKTHLNTLDKLHIVRVKEPHVNPNTQTKEFSLRDPDGYYVTISAHSAV